MQPDCDLSCRRHDEPFPQKVKTVARLEDAVIRFQCQTVFSDSLPDNFTAFPDDPFVMAQHKEIVVIPDIAGADRFDLVVDGIEQRHLIQLIDLTAEAGSTFAERVFRDLISRPRIALHVDDLVKILYKQLLSDPFPVILFHLLLRRCREVLPDVDMFTEHVGSGRFSVELLEELDDDAENHVLTLAFLAGDVFSDESRRQVVVYAVVAHGTLPYAVAEIRCGRNPFLWPKDFDLRSFPRVIGA